jgi:PAS domain S-box-containing protein
MPLKFVTERLNSNAIIRYGLAIAAAVLAVALRLWLTPLLGEGTPYITVFVMVLFSAHYLGLGPAIVTVATSLLGVWIWVIAPHGLALDRFEIFGILVFLIFSAIIVVFGEGNRRSQARQNEIEQTLRENESRLRLAVQQMQSEVEHRTAEIEHKTAQTQEQARFLDLANDAIFVRTSRDRISYWNQGAQRLYGWTKEEALGRLAHELLGTRFPSPLSQLQNVDYWQGEVLQVKRDGSEIIVASRWTTLRDREGKFDGWLEINTDITARRRAEDAARRLSGRILSLQDDERRRIARELHDSLGQYLVSIKMNLDLLSTMIKDDEQSAIISSCVHAAHECLSETRTISHLLHPPLLDEAGFASAARWFIEGFAERSGLQVNLDISPDLARLNRDTETTLFRILQEALTNVHRHSEGTSVQINLQVDAEHVRLGISDNGKGIPEDRLRRLSDDDSETGVGLAGMRERVRELGGSLAITAASPGTTITVNIPIFSHAESHMLGRREVASRRVSAA